MAEVPSGTVTFLFTDIEGSTRLLKGLRERYGEVLAQHRQILRDAFAANGGEEVDTQGDSFFVAFRRAQDAVLAAADAQRALAAHEWPEGGELRVRMGIHTGQVAVSGDHYVGVAVHRAARICAAGHGGQVLVSQTTKGLLDDEEVELPDVEFRDLGEQRLKDLDRPIRLFQLVGEGLSDEFPPLNTLDSEPARGLRPFAGREEELAEATASALGRRRLPVRNLAIAAAALVLIVPPVAVVLAGRSGGAKAMNVRPNSVAVIDPTSNKVVGDVSVGRDPAQLAYANGNVWVVNGRDATLSRISAPTLEASPPAGVSAQDVTDLAAGFGSLWLATGDGGTVVRFDPTANRAEDPIEMPRLKGAGSGPSYVHAVAVDGHGIWAFDETQAAAFRIDPPSRKVDLAVARAVGGVFYRGFNLGDPGWIVTGFGRVWIGDGVAGTLNEVNPSTRSVIASIPLPPPATGGDINDPSALAAGEGAVWLTSYSRGLLWRVDPSTSSLANTIPVGRGAQGVAVGEGGVWVANSVDGTVSRVDPETKEVVATIHLGHLPSWVAVGGGRVWVSVQP